MINENEIQLVRHAIAYALTAGASACRISLNKSVMDSYSMLNGALDKVVHSADCSLYIYLYAEERYATFSTNKMDVEDVESFIRQALVMTKMLEQDSTQQLPAAERQAKDALTGREMGLYDPYYEEMDSDSRLELAKRLSIFDNTPHEGENYSLISEECEFSTSLDDNYTADSQGFEGRHTETAFGCSCEMTIADQEGHKYSGNSWTASPVFADLDLEAVCREALMRATDSIAPQKRRSGSYRMVVSNRVASKMVTSIFNALNASAMQQKTSFLQNSLGKRIFSEGLTIMDMSRTPGKAGSRLYDSEGVASIEDAVIEKGVVKKYFVNTQMSLKMGLEPTIEDITRPVVLPYLKGTDLSARGDGLSMNEILLYCRNGIYVTGFNGGNCNAVTGDFSFGIEGFAFKNGRLAHPVREMVITGNMLELWNNFIAAGSDYRECARWQIPTLAFENVYFSA